MNDGTGTKRTSRAEYIQARKFEIFCALKTLRTRLCSPQSLAQIDNPTNDSIVLLTFLRVAQHIISSIDALHLNGPFRSCQIGMIEAGKLSIGSLQCVAISIYRDA